MSVSFADQRRFNVRLDGERWADRSENFDTKINGANTEQPETGGSVTQQRKATAGSSSEDQSTSSSSSQNNISLKAATTAAAQHGIREVIERDRHERNGGVNVKFETVWHVPNCLSEKLKAIQNLSLGDHGEYKGSSYLEYLPRDNFNGKKEFEGKMKTYFRPTSTDTLKKKQGVDKYGMFGPAATKEDTSPLKSDKPRFVNYVHHDRGHEMRTKALRNNSTGRTPYVDGGMLSWNPRSDMKPPADKPRWIYHMHMPDKMHTIGDNNRISTICTDERRARDKAKQEHKGPSTKAFYKGMRPFTQDEEDSYRQIHEKLLSLKMMKMGAISKINKDKAHLQYQKSLHRQRGQKMKQHRTAEKNTKKERSLKWYSSENSSSSSEVDDSDAINNTRQHEIRHRENNSTATTTRKILDSQQVQPTDDNRTLVTASEESEPIETGGMGIQRLARKERGCYSARPALSGRMKISMKKSSIARPKTAWQTSGRTERSHSQRTTPHLRTSRSFTFKKSDAIPGLSLSSNSRIVYRDPETVREEIRAAFQTPKSESSKNKVKAPTTTRSRRVVNSASPNYHGSNTGRSKKRGNGSKKKKKNSGKVIAASGHMTHGNETTRSDAVDFKVEIEVLESSRRTPFYISSGRKKKANYMQPSLSVKNGSSSNRVHGSNGNRSQRSSFAPFVLDDSSLSLRAKGTSAKIGITIPKSGRKGPGEPTASLSSYRLNSGAISARPSKKLWHSTQSSSTNKSLTFRKRTNKA